MGRRAGFDHLAITAADPEATMSFYRDVLSAEVLCEHKWREGKIPCSRCRSVPTVSTCMT